MSVRDLATISHASIADTNQVRFAELLLLVRLTQPRDLAPSYYLNR